MRRKGTLSCLLAGALMLGCITGCGSAGGGNAKDISNAETQGTEAGDIVNTSGDTTEAAKEDTEETAESSDGEKLKIVTTIFPEYDWVKNILGDKAENAELTLLINNGTDLHSYQPSVEDIAAVQTCDLFVYVGGESDEWVDEVLEGAENTDMVVINLLEVLGDSVKAEEIVEGMEHNHEHEHEHEEITEEDIKDRSLAEFEGEWKSLYPLAESGELDEYVEHHAEEHGEPVEEVKEELLAKWSCEADGITVAGDEITFNYSDGKTVTAAYTYAGYTPVKDEDGDITGVRYQFETDSADAPKYVQLNDHGHEPAEEVEHFHIYFGNESFEALGSSASNPFFVPEALGTEEILEELMGGHSHEEEMDEHVWLSLNYSAAVCEEIADSLCSLDSANSDTYKANLDAYVNELSSLDAEYKEVVDAASTKTLLFGDRFPFRYLVDDYGLEYYAAFAGCSAESEASFETVIFLAEKVDELGLTSIMTIEGDEHKIAETVRDNTKTKDQKILTMDSLQSTTTEDIENGTTYLSVMKANLEVLKEALN